MTAVAALPPNPLLLGPSLHAGFFHHAQVAAERIALEVDGEAWTYGRLCSLVSRVAATLVESTPSGGSPLTAVFAQRSVTTAVGILAALAAGRGYVPLNRAFPVERTRLMLRTAGCRAIIVDTQSAPQLEGLLEGIDEPLLILVLGDVDLEPLAERWPIHRFVGPEGLASGKDFRPCDADGEDVAYLLFTSGSTGVPKAVPVTHANAAQFVRSVTARYGIGPEDRFSHLFDTTFDLSVFDMFVAWRAGACVCTLPQAALINPDAFIRTRALTVWLSVPSVGVFMRRMGTLKPGQYPSLRLSLFCGEALPVTLAAAWAEAAPDSIVENLYGPTEATVMCTAYRWEGARARQEAERGIVPIGEPLPGVLVRIVNDTMQEVAPGEVGELLLGGGQVTRGYWNNRAATLRSYIDCDGEVFYRTGDRVRRPSGNGPLTFLGRLDEQVKVLGFRVELGEIEACLRADGDVSAAAVVAWPQTEAGAAGIVAFVAGRRVDPAGLRSRLQQTLPPYAVPRSIHVIDHWPLNSNGKTDRHALLARLNDGPSHG
jgi:amino acid adenylation domain-containing protein